MISFSVIVQASPDEVLGGDLAQNSVLPTLCNDERVKEVVVVMPEMGRYEEATKKLCESEFEVKVFVGDAYNVAKRIVDAHNAFCIDQEFCVRVLIFWKHIDLDYITYLVETFLGNICDICVPPIDFDITMAADIAALTAINKVANLSGHSQEIWRAKFNPWGYIELHPEIFDVHYVDYAPQYNSYKIQKILLDKRSHPENEYFGRNYQGSRYHFIEDNRFIKDGAIILDIACGSGFGSELLSRRASLVVGVDYLSSYIENAIRRYGHINNLQFIVADAQNFLYMDKEEYFDVVVSLHTLEHVPNDRLMLRSLYNNLRKEGKLILEVPLLRKRPLGVPINPYHYREYHKEDIVDMIEKCRV